MQSSSDGALAGACASLRSLVVAGVGVAIAIALAFEPLFRRPWASSDDYAFLATAHQGGSALDLVVRDGRPLHGWFYDLIVTHVHSTGDLAAFRGVFVGSLFLAAIALLVVLRRTFASTGVAFVVTVLAMTGLAWVDIASLTPGATVPVGVLCGIGAFVLSDRAGALRSAASAALLVTSFAVYTTSAFVYVALVGVTCCATEPLREGVRTAAKRLALFTAAAVAYAVVFVVAVPRMLGLEVTERATLTTNPLVKLAALVALPLRDAFNLFVLFPRDFVWESHRAAAHGRPDLARFVVDAAQDPATLMAVAVFVAMAMGLWCFAPQATTRDRVARLAVGLVFLPLSYGANLPLQSLWSPFRTQLALALVVVGFLALGMAPLRRALGGRAPRRTRGVTVASATLVVVLAVASARSVVAAWVVEPLGCERDALLAAIAALPGDDVVVAPPAAGTTAAPGIRYELGRPAAAAPWAPAAMVHVARRELGRGRARVTVVDADARDAVALGCPAQRPTASAR